MVYTRVELGTNYSNNKRKIMKELELKQTRKVVKDYITERFIERYFGDHDPSDWEKHSNGDLERCLDDLDIIRKGKTKELKELLDNFLLDEKKDEQINLSDDQIINEFIEDECWSLVYNEIFEKIEGYDFGDKSERELDDMVDLLDELISVENTSLHIMEILTSRVGLEEKITYKSK